MQNVISMKEEALQKVSKPNGLYEYVRISWFRCQNSRKFRIYVLWIEGSIYNNFIETEWKILEVQSKWSAALNYGIEHHLIGNAFKTLWKMTQDRYLMYIQYKILHHRVATNDILLKMASKTNYMAGFSQTPGRIPFSQRG